MEVADRVKFIDEGRAAFVNGIPSKNCPYKMLTDWNRYDVWTRGWTEMWLLNNYNKKQKIINKI